LFAVCTKIPSNDDGTRYWNQQAQTLLACTYTELAVSCASLTIPSIEQQRDLNSFFCHLKARSALLIIPLFEQPRNQNSCSVVSKAAALPKTGTKVVVLIRVLHLHSMFQREVSSGQVLV
jgi:hypothetical protein